MRPAPTGGPAGGGAGDGRVRRQGSESASTHFVGQHGSQRKGTQSQRQPASQPASQPVSCPPALPSRRVQHPPGSGSRARWQRSSRAPRHPPTPVWLHRTCPTPGCCHATAGGWSWGKWPGTAGVPCTAALPAPPAAPAAPAALSWDLRRQQAGAMQVAPGQGQCPLPSAPRHHPPSCCTRQTRRSSVGKGRIHTRRSGRLSPHLCRKETECQPAHWFHPQSHACARPGHLRNSRRVPQANQKK